MAFRIQIRRDSSLNWEINNPVLLQGEFGYETNTDCLKIGDGQTEWNSLPYLVYLLFYYDNLCNYQSILH